MMASDARTLARSSSSTRDTSVGNTSAREDTYSSAGGDSLIAATAAAPADTEEEGASPRPPPGPDALEPELLDATRMCGGAR